MTKDYIKMFISMIMMYYISFFVGIGLGLLNISIEKNMQTIAVLEITISFILAIIISLIYLKLLKNDIKKKIDIRDIITNVLTLFGVKLILSIIVGLICNVLGFDINSSTNQELIEQILKSYPLIMLVSASIFGPIYEELIYRGGVRSIIKNKKVFVLVSGLTFGLAHVTDSLMIILGIVLIGIIISVVKDKKLSVTMVSLTIILMLSILFIKSGGLLALIHQFNLNEMLNGIIYVGLGICMADMYVNSDNIINNIVVHGIYNLLNILMLLFLI